MRQIHPMSIERREQDQGMRSKRTKHSTHVEMRNASFDKAEAETNWKKVVERKPKSLVPRRGGRGFRCPALASVGAWGKEGGKHQDSQHGYILGLW